MRFHTFAPSVSKSPCCETRRIIVVLGSDPGLQDGQEWRITRWNDLFALRKTRFCLPELWYGRVAHP